MDTKTTELNCGWDYAQHFFQKDETKGQSFHQPVLQQPRGSSLFKPEEQWLTEPVKKLNATSGKIFLEKLKFNTPKAFFFALAQGFDPDA